MECCGCDSDNVVLCLCLLRLCVPLLCGHSPPAVHWGSGWIGLDYPETLHCVIERDWAPCSPLPLRQLLHTHTHTHTTARIEVRVEWDVTDPARCRIWHSNPSIVLHIDLRVCAIPNCDWRLQRSQLLSTLHWAVLPESSLPTVPELINDFFQRKLHCCVGGRKFDFGK